MANSQSYWKKREQEHQKKRIKDEKKLLRLLEKRYVEAYDAVLAGINQAYANYASSERITIEDAKLRAEKADIEKYAKKARKYVKERNFSPRANSEMRLYNMTMRVNRLELLKTNIGLEMVDLFDNLDKFYSQTLSGEARSEFERQAGILSETGSLNKKTLDRIVKASFHNATFSERIWANQSGLKSELDKLLVRGFTQGKNPRVLAREIKKAFGVSRHEADRLLVTEMARVQLEAQREAYDEFGYDEYEYIAETTACGVCKPFDGKIFKVKDMEIGENAYPMHPNCHCSTAAHFDREAWDKDLKARGL